MAHVIYVTDPFQPQKNTQVFPVEKPITVSAWLQHQFPGFVEFDRPTICLYNGNPLLREEWGTTIIRGEDVVTFATAPGEVITVIYAILIIITVASVAIAISAKKPTANIQAAQQDSLQGDPVYTLRGQRNQVKLGDVIEVPYGRCRIWPSYAALPYNKYQNNDQWLYQLFCIGQGEYQIETNELFIEDTPISNFADVEVEIIPPGGEVTLFPNNVVTSPEINNTELLGINQPESGHVYVIDVEEEGYEDPETGEWIVTVPEQGHWEYDAVGPFVANPAGTECDKIEIDLTLPKGLYYSNNNGGLDGRTVTAVFEARKIDNAGAPLGDWFLLNDFSKTMATATPQRITISEEVELGRYEVRGYRDNVKDLSSRAANDLFWESLRAFLPNTNNYGNCTLMAVKARATNNLNSNAQTRFNVFATRKLPVWSKLTQTWSAPTATRSIVWAFCDIFRAQYGAQLANTYLQLDALADLDAVYTTRLEFFDWVFDQQATAWECARLVGRAGRAIPMLQGSQITLVRDEPKTLPTSVFNLDNIVEGSFRWDIKLHSIDANDGLEVSYTDPTTWKEETVRCLLPLSGGGNEAGDNPKRVKYQGITDRDHAYRLGMYDRAITRYVRENIIFKTGLEGHIPGFGDLIMVSHDIPRWASGGRVLSVSGGINLTLSEPVVFEVGQTHKIVLRRKDGSATLPLDVSAGTDAYHVVLALPLDMSGFSFSEQNESPIFLFGKTSFWGKACKVMNLTPSEDDTVEITAVNYTDVPFSFDEYDAPSLPASPVGLPSVPALPSVAGLSVVRSPSIPNQVFATWLPAAGAQYYVVQKSYNNADWEFAARVTEATATFDVLPQYIYVRVAAVNLGQGAWSNVWQGLPPADVSTSPIDDGVTPTNASVALTPGETNVRAVFTWPTNTTPKYLHIYVSQTTVQPTEVTWSIPYPQGSFLIPGLAANTTYNFWHRVEAVNGRFSATSAMYSTTTEEDSYQSSIEALARTFASSLQDSADRAAELLQEIEDRETGIYEEQIARETADIAEAALRTSAVANLQGQVDNRATIAALNSEIIARVDADAAEVYDRVAAVANLQSQLNTTNASLVTESNTRATADAAEVTARTTAVANLQTQVDARATTAYVDNLINTLVTQDEALARTISNLSASLGETSAYVQVLADAYVDSAGNAVARWGVELTAETAGTKVITGIQAIAQNGPSPISAVRILANIFEIVASVNGVASTPFVLNATTGSLTLGVDLVSDNFIAVGSPGGPAGYKLTRSSGSAEFAGNFRAGDTDNYLSFSGGLLEVQTGLFNLNTDGMVFNYTSSGGADYVMAVDANWALVDTVGPIFKVSSEFSGLPSSTTMWHNKLTVSADNGSEVQSTVLLPGAINVQSSNAEYRTNGTKVVGQRQAAIADANGTLSDLNAKFNTLLSYLRPSGHGLIET